MTITTALSEEAPYWTRKSEDARIVAAAVRMMWLRINPEQVAKYIEAEVNS